MTETPRKTVDLTDEVDDEQQIATGALLVPNRVDSQGDFFRPEAIRAIAHDYMDRLQRGEAELKFMHAVDAGGKLSLVENRVLDEPETIGDTEHAAGTWVVSVKAHDATVWQAFKRGLFGGFSIGGEIESGETLAPAELPRDVGVPPEHPDGAPIQRIDDATLHEFSAVDEPAVPRARVEVLKSVEKGHADAVAEGGEACLEALMERGHSEEEAELLCEAIHKQELPQPVKDCKDSVLEDNPGMSESEAIAICRDQLGMAADALKQEDVDTTPPQDVQDAAQTALDTRDDPDVDVSGCGTQTGWTRANQLAGGESLSEETINRMVSFLSRHLAQAPDDLSTLDRDSCQRVMIQAWGGRPGLRWGESMQEQLANLHSLGVEAYRRAWAAKFGDDHVMTSKGETTVTKQEYNQGDWVVWEQADGDTRGRVVRSITAEGETFDDSAYTGDANVPQADEDDPVYLIEVWGGFGDDASARESNQSGPDTVHVVHLESRMTDVSDPRDREAAAAGLLERAKSLLTPGSTDDAGNSAEDSEGIDMEKVGRTLSQANERETKAVHDAAATMLERADCPDHSSARTYTADPDDEFEMGEHYEKMLTKQDIPMPGEAQLLYGDEDTAMSVAEEMGLDGVHEHTLDGETFFMPGETHADFEEAMGGMEQGGHEDDDHEQGEHDDEKVQASDEPAESGADADADTETKMSDEKLDTIIDKLNDLDERVDEIDERVDKVAGKTADSDQVEGGTETETTETSETEKFLTGLTGGR